jgi:hypothetical protein
MPEDLVPVTRTKEVKPDGAAEDAAVFREVALQCREFGDQLRYLRSNLENVWEGRSKERFFHDYGFTTKPVEMDFLAVWLESQAVKIDRKRVTIEYTVLVPARTIFE